MRRRLEASVPVLVFLGFLAAAVVVNLLLNSAESRGVTALEESVTSEVQAVAGSQNQRFLNTFSGAVNLSGGLSGEPFELTEGSQADLRSLQGILEAVPNARSGFYLLDADGRITQGVLLKDGVLGSSFEWPGLDALKAAGGLEAGGVLPLSEGLTTDEPVVAFILPIRADPVPPAQVGERRGSFVFEQVVAVDSDLNKEIGALRRGDTGQYYFFDTSGGVIASNDSAAIGHKLDDERFLTEPAGLHRLGDHVVVLADVPVPHWRVAFRQNNDEFERALTGPLQSTGRVIIFALLAAGVVLTVLLYRRLRAARAEQERLRVLSESQQEFISIVSHELRTPVAGVLGFLETSLDHWDAMDDNERKAAVGRAASNARRLQAMTRDVLDTQSVEAGRLVHVFQRLDLGNEARIAVDAAHELDPDRQFDLHLADAPVWVEGDPDRLQQVLANLLENARKNSPAMDPIDVSVQLTDGLAEVVVADHGPGIDDESLERIFEKFVRGRGDSVSGTGLGLYISRQIVNAHDGRIWAESEPGHGATFRFVLPVAADGGAEGGAEEARVD